MVEMRFGDYLRLFFFLSFFDPLKQLPLTFDFAYLPSPPFMNSTWRNREKVRSVK